MANNILPIFTIFLSVIFLWIIVLTFYLKKINDSFNKLAKIDGSGNLQKILELLITTIEGTRVKIEKLQNDHLQLENKSHKHLQKFSLVRYNPFEDTGGDQSFCISLLDEENNGLVISVLHGRGGTRIYSKPVKAGLGDGYDLSEEEKQAIKKAEEILK